MITPTDWGNAPKISKALLGLSIILSIVMIIFLFMLVVSPRVLGMQGIQKAPDSEVEANNDGLLFHRMSSDAEHFLQRKMII